MAAEKKKARTIVVNQRVPEVDAVLRQDYGEDVVIYTTSELVDAKEKLDRLFKLLGSGLYDESIGQIMYAMVKAFSVADSGTETDVEMFNVEKRPTADALSDLIGVSIPMPGGRGRAVFPVIGEAGHIEKDKPE